MTIEVQYAVEGATDEPVVERLIESCGGLPKLRLNARGKSRLDPKVTGIQRASSRFSPWFILRDLDTDALCAGQLVSLLTSIQSEFAILRIAVPEVEAWLLADHEGFAEEFAVSIAHLPREPDEVPDGKLAVVAACRKSKRKLVREDMSPQSGSGRSVGPGFEGAIIQFARNTWNPERAANLSPSLRKAKLRLSEMLDLCGDASDHQ